MEKNIILKTSYILAKVAFAYSTTDSFVQPIPVFDWFRFCRKNLTLHQKNKLK